MDWNDLANTFNESLESLTDLSGAPDQDTSKFPIPGAAVALSIRTSRTLNAVFNKGGTETVFQKWVTDLKAYFGNNTAIKNWNGDAKIFFDLWPSMFPGKDPKNFASYNISEWSGATVLTANSGVYAPSSTTYSEPYLKEAMWIVDRLNQIITIVKDQTLTPDVKDYLMKSLTVSRDDWSPLAGDSAVNFENVVVKTRDSLLAQISLFAKLGFPPAAYASPFRAFTGSLKGDAVKLAKAAAGAFQNAADAVNWFEAYWPWILGGTAVLYFGLLFKR